MLGLQELALILIVFVVIWIIGNVGHIKSIGSQRESRNTEKLRSDEQKPKEYFQSERRMRLFFSYHAATAQHEARLAANTLRSDKYDAWFQPFIWDYMPASSRDVRDTYLRHAREADVFVMVLGRELRPAMKEEFDAAVAGGVASFVVLLDVTQTLTAEAARFLEELPVAHKRYSSILEFEKLFDSSLHDEVLRRLTEGFPASPKQVVALALLLAHDDAQKGLWLHRVRDRRGYLSSSLYSLAKKLGECIAVVTMDPYSNKYLELEGAIEWAMKLRKHAPESPRAHDLLGSFHYVLALNRYLGYYYRKPRHWKDIDLRMKWSVPDGTIAPPGWLPVNNAAIAAFATMVSLGPENVLGRIKYALALHAAGMSADALTELEIARELVRGTGPHLGHTTVEDVNLLIRQVSRGKPVHRFVSESDSWAWARQKNPDNRRWFLPAYG